MVGPNCVYKIIIGFKTYKLKMILKTIGNLLEILVRELYTYKNVSN